jgi:hypothetical protein
MTLQLLNLLALQNHLVLRSRKCKMSLVTYGPKLHFINTLNAKTEISVVETQLAFSCHLHTDQCGCKANTALLTILIV